MCDHILDKNIWTQDDFDIMNWQDARIYGVIIEKGENPWDTDILYDIDYVFKRVEPASTDNKPAFWIAPCTLVFKGAFDFRSNTNTHGGFLDLLEIMNLLLISVAEGNRDIYEWRIELLHGNMCLKSRGFDMIVRKQPLLVQKQVLDMGYRDKISFSKEPYQK